MKQRILGIFAHPDDESLLCGGTLAKHVRSGHAVSIYVLSDGETSRIGWTKKDVERRLEQFLSACRVLGANGHARLMFSDQQSDLLTHLELNRCVEQIIGEESPDLVYSHSLADLNHDHRRVAEAVLVATRDLCGVKCVQPEYPERGWPFVPNVFNDIKATLKMKLEACAQYCQELRPYPHRRSLKAIGRQTKERFLAVPK